MMYHVVGIRKNMSFNTKDGGEMSGLKLHLITWKVWLLIPFLFRLRLLATRQLHLSSLKMTLKSFSIVMVKLIPS